MKAGDVVDIWDGGALVCAVYLGDEKGRLKLMTPAGREMRVLPNRVAVVIGLDSSKGMHAAERAASHDARLTELAAQIDLESLWEVVVDEGGSWSLESLAELAFGEASGLERAALLRALVRSPRHFTRKQMTFVPRGREELEEFDRRVRVEADRERRREDFLAAARRALASTGEPAPDWPPGSERYLELLKDVAVHGAGAARLKEATPLLKELGVQLGGHLELEMFELLVRLHVLEPDENLLLERHAVRSEFPAAVIAEAEALERAGFDRSGRRDLTALATYAIDDAQTTEVDDAVSIEAGPAPDHFRVGVHIADPAAFVRRDSLVDEEAFKRSTTFYLPNLRLLMLPEALSERAASLKPGELRPALSFFATLDAAGEVSSFELAESIIRVSRRLTYEECDALIAEGGGAPGLGDDLAGFEPSVELLQGDEASRPARELALMARLMRRVLEQRAARGALILKSPDLDVKLVEGRIVIRKLDPSTAAWTLVSEAMVLANRLGAERLRDTGTPALYRRQPAPDSPVAMGRDYDPVAFAQARRAMKPTDTGVEPGPHAGLGAACYTQLSSPLRRYQDLVMHRQLKALARGEPPPYDLEAVQRVAATTEQAERAAREVERGTREYYLLKHLDALAPGTPLQAIVTRPEERRTLIELEDYLYVTAIAPRHGHKPGTRLSVVIEAVHPRAGRLVVRES